MKFPLEGSNFPFFNLTKCSGQKLADPQQNRITLNRPLGIDYGDSSSENEDDEDEQKGGQRETEAKSAIPGSRSPVSKNWRNFKINFYWAAKF